jgi:hypothetical protein
MLRKRWLAELSELRAIFNDCLPIGEKTEDVERYFNSLKEVIYTNDFQANPDPLRREEFEHDEPDIQYSYLSDALFKERSSRQNLRTHGQIMDDQPHGHPGEIPQLGRQITADLTPISECADKRDSQDIWGEGSDNTGW